MRDFESPKKAKIRASTHVQAIGDNQNTSRDPNQGKRGNHKASVGVEIGSVGKVTLTGTTIEILQKLASDNVIRLVFKFNSQQCFSAESIRCE